MPRFVIQQHTQPETGDRNIHYDLMLEFSDVLKTWRIANPPDQLPQTLQQIPDHRKLYLDYEGGISGNRGSVKIWDKGDYLIHSWSETFIDLEFLGQKLHLHGHLRLTQPPHWVFEKVLEGTHP